MKRRYDAVIFDLDGTLIDSWEALHDAVNEALRSADHRPVSKAEVVTSVGDGIETLLERCMGRRPTSDVLDAFIARYDQVCCEKSRTLDGVESTLLALSSGGVAMAVCTNKPTGFSRKIVDALGLGGYFEHVVGPDLAGFRKPDPRHVMVTVERAGADAARSLFVGDMPVDIEAASAAGLHVAAIPTGSVASEVLLSCGSDYMLERFDDLVGIVFGEKSAA